MPREAPSQSEGEVLGHAVHLREDRPAGDHGDEDQARRGQSGQATDASRELRPVHRPDHAAVEGFDETFLHICKLSQRFSN